MEYNGGQTELSVVPVKAVINTTNIIDSHMDCHIPGLWKKTLSESTLLYWLQEHEMEFKYIIADSIADGLKASSEMLTWSDIGYQYKGQTEALIFSANISKSRNEFMFNQYLKGYVHNHSVGMRYVKLYLCLDSEQPEHAAEKENWNKYYPEVVNKEVADEYGYFWAVTEAKVIEGSAVVKGSNQATPTLEVGQAKHIEPSVDTQEPGNESGNSHNANSEPNRTKLSIQNFL
jgi:hypothetical protein